MTRVALVASGLLMVYLLVLTSVAPGDVVIGALLAAAVTFALRPSRSDSRGLGLLGRVVGGAGLAGQTAAEMVRGSWGVARFCLRGQAEPRIVEVPRGERSPGAVALWGVLTGEAPDEIVVDVDETRSILVVQVLDASDPDAVRDRHARTYERWQRRVVP